MNTSIFVGRTDELNLLNRLLEETKKGYGKLVFVSGEAGAGKSTLIHHFFKSLDEGNLIAFVECSDLDGTNPYAPIKEVLAELNADDFAKTAEEKREFSSLFKRILNEAGADWVAAIPILGSLTAAGIRTIRAILSHFRNLRPTAIKIRGTEQIQQLFGNELCKLAKKQPVIIFLDDLQWADPSSLNMIFALGRSLRKNPFSLLLIGSYRPDQTKRGIERISDDGTFIYRPHPLEINLVELERYANPATNIARKDKWLVRIEVPAFKEDEIYDLINEEFPENDFPDDFASQLKNITQGNPFFVNAVLEFLKQHRDISRGENGVFKLENDVLDVFPASLESVIRMRLIYLNKELNEILNCASLIGEKFAAQMIAPLLGMEVSVLMEKLQELHKKYDLVIPELVTEVLNNVVLYYYHFKHTLVRKFVYEKMDEGVRKNLHERAAKVLKDLFGGDLEKLKEMKVIHDRHIQIAKGLINGITLQLTKGTVKDTKKVKILLEAAANEVMAARQSFDQFAMEECLEKAIRALSFLAKLEHIPIEAKKIEFKALLLKDEAKEWLGYFTDAARTAEELVRIAEEIKDKKDTAVAYIRLGKDNVKLGNYDDAIKCYKKAMGIFEDLKDWQKVADSYNKIGVALWEKGKYDEAAEFHKNALEIFEEFGDKRNIAESFNNLGQALWAKGSYDKALEYHKKAFPIFKELNDIRNLSGCYNNIGLDWKSIGSYEESIEYHKKSLTIKKRLNDKVGIADSYNNIGNALCAKGDYNEALKYHKEALQICKDLDDSKNIACSYTNIGNTLNEKDDLDEAYNYYKMALEIYTNLNDRVMMANNYNNIGTIYCKKGYYDSATEYHKKALGISKLLNDRLCTARIYLSMGSTLKESGDHDAAIVYYENALKIYETTEDRVWRARCYNGLGIISNAKKNYAAAIGHFKKVLTIYKILKDDWRIVCTYINIGKSFYGGKNYENAIKMFEMALQISDYLKDCTLKPRIYIEIGTALGKSGNYENAIDYYKKALEILNLNLESNAKVLKAYCYNNIGTTLFYKENYKDAITHYEKAYKISKDLVERDKMAVCWGKIASDLEAEKKFKDALENLKKSREIWSELGNYEEVEILNEKINKIKTNLQRRERGSGK